eukprot:3379522-Amphidinium_carterae.1
MIPSGPAKRLAMSLGNPIISNTTPGKDTKDRAKLASHSCFCWGETKNERHFESNSCTVSWVCLQGWAVPLCGMLLF